MIKKSNFVIMTESMKPSDVLLLMRMYYIGNYSLSREAKQGLQIEDNFITNHIQ